MGRRTAATGLLLPQGHCPCGMRPPLRRRKVRSAPFSPTAKTAPAPLLLLSPPRGARRGPRIERSKRECAAPGGREKALRRVGLRQRRPPAADGGWLAVPCGSQRRKRPALGETSSPGKLGIPFAPLFAAAGRWLMRVSTWANATAPTIARAARSDCAAVGGFAAYGCGVPLAGKRNARKEKLLKCVLAPRRGRNPRHGTAVGGTAEDPSVPEGQAKSEQAPIRRPPYSNFARTCKVATKAVFSFGPCTARFLFGKTEKKMGGALPSYQHSCHPPAKRLALCGPARAL